MKHMVRTLVLGAGFALTLASCGGGSTGGQNKIINRIPVPESSFKPTELETTIGSLVKEIGKMEAQPAQLSVILKELTGYWEPITKGANRAIGELDVPGSVSAPTESTPEARTTRQIEVFNNQLTAGYNGFALAPLNDMLLTQVDAAADAGHPVITIDSDLPTSKRALYVGTINSEAGKTAGNTLLGQLGSLTSGTIVLLGHDNEEWADGYARTKGAKDVLEARGFTVVIRRSTWTDTGFAEDVAAMSQTITEASPPVVGMMGMFSNAYRCAAAAEMAGKTASDIAVVAFDFEPQTLAYMQSGFIRATHAQRQYYMGYLVPYLLYGVNALGLEKTKQIMAPHMVDGARINTGLDVVGASQVNEYNAFLDSLGIGG